MTLVVPNVAEVKVLELFLERVLTLKLYANDVVPAESDVAGTYTEVAGGGYAAKTLASDGWTITPGAPSQGVYEVQEWTLTGPTGGSGEIYGYFVIDAEGELCWAERFSESIVPFVPVEGSVIRITPQFQAS